MNTFMNRQDAGRKLAAQLEQYRGDPNLIVLGLPRGGVIVAYEIARALNAPLDVFIVRKLGVPGHEELAMGAIAISGMCVLNESVLRRLKIPKAEIHRVTQNERLEMMRRETVYRGNRAPLSFKDKIILLVDDGLATGATMQVAVRALRTRWPKKIIVAVPVASQESAQELSVLADDLICLEKPWDFRAVGQFYDDFQQISDDEVREKLFRSELVKGKQ